MGQGCIFETEYQLLPCKGILDSTVAERVINVPEQGTNFLKTKEKDDCIVFSFGAEFVGMEMKIGVWHKLRMMVVTISSPIYIYDDKMLFI